MTITKERLMNLQRTVDTLQERVEDMQCELRQAKRPMVERLWSSLLPAKQSNAFMSACCNRRARPNTKMVDYAAARNQQ
jgi:hypothetical protein